MTSPFSIGEALSFGWHKTKRHLGFFILVLLFAFALRLILNFVVPEEGIGLAIAQLVLFFVYMFMAAIWVNILLGFHDGDQISIKALVPSLRTYLNFLAGIILYGLIVIGGLILLIIPGIIWALKYQFVGFIVLDKGVDPIAALRKSGEITHGQKWDLLGFVIVRQLVLILGALALGIGLLMSIPVASIAQIHVYRKLYESRA